MEIPAKIEDRIVDPTNYIDGIFYFSNTSENPFIALWNNVEYTFAPETCSPIMIQDCTPVQIQEIRKRWAYKWAEEQWFGSKEYKHLVKIGRDKPSARDDQHLEPLIQMCLTPLPLKKATEKTITRKIRTSGKSRPVDDSFDAKATYKDATEEDMTERV